MSEYDAFLRAVRASPLDDAPRLAFADWLDEHPLPDRRCPNCKRPRGAINHVPGHFFVGWGHGWQPCLHCDATRKCPDTTRKELAEFIRLQHALVRDKAKGACPKCGKRWTRVVKKSYPVPMSVCYQCHEDGPFWPDVAEYVAKERRAEVIYSQPLYKHDVTKLPWGRARYESTGRGFVESVHCHMRTLFAYTAIEKLFSQHPIIRIATDRHPLKQPRGIATHPYVWMFPVSGNRRPLTDRVERTYLRGELLGWVARGHDTREAAEEALSNGIVNYGRSLVGLDPIYPIPGKPER